MTPGSTRQVCSTRSTAPAIRRSRKTARRRRRARSGHRPLACSSGYTAARPPTSPRLLRARSEPGDVAAVGVHPPSRLRPGRTPLIGLAAVPRTARRPPHPSPPSPVLRSGARATSSPSPDPCSCSTSHSPAPSQCAAPPARCPSTADSARDTGAPCRRLDQRWPGRGNSPPRSPASLHAPVGPVDVVDDLDESREPIGRTAGRPPQHAHRSAEPGSSVGSGSSTARRRSQVQRFPDRGTSRSSAAPPRPEPRSDAVAQPRPPGWSSAAHPLA
jgi:hypothetical protein